MRQGNIILPNGNRVQVPGDGDSIDLEIHPHFENILRPMAKILGEPNYSRLAEHAIMQLWQIVDLVILKGQTLTIEPPGSATMDEHEENCDEFEPSGQESEIPASEGTGPL